MSEQKAELRGGVGEEEGEEEEREEEERKERLVYYCEVLNEQLLFAKRLCHVGLKGLLHPDPREFYGLGLMNVTFSKYSILKGFSFISQKIRILAGKVVQRVKSLATKPEGLRVPGTVVERENQYL